MLKARPDLNKKNERGESPLHISIEKKDCYTLRVLVTAGADVNTDNKWGESALERALEHGHALGILTLLKAGADLGEDPDDILNLARRHDLPEVERLIVNITNIEKNLEQEAIKKHVLKANLNLIDYLFQQKDLKTRANGINLLSLALSIEDEPAMMEMVDLLIDGGLSPNGEPSDSLVPLVEAVKLGNEKRTDILLKKGADPNKLDKEGLSALAHALDKLDVKTAQKLLKYQADVTYSYTLGETRYERNVCSLLPENKYYLGIFRNLSRQQKKDKEELEELLNCR